MTFADVFRPRRASAPRASCPFCRGPSGEGPLCSVCLEESLRSGRGRA